MFYLECCVAAYGRGRVRALRGVQWLQWLANRFGVPCTGFGKMACHGFLQYYAIRDASLRDALHRRKPGNDSNSSAPSNRMPTYVNRHARRSYRTLCTHTTRAGVAEYQYRVHSSTIHTLVRVLKHSSIEVPETTHFTRTVIRKIRSYKLRNHKNSRYNSSHTHLKATEPHATD